MADLFAVFFKVGLLTVGGGYAMIPLMQQEVVAARGWMSLEQMTDMIAVAEVTPGPFAVNMATFVGWAQHGAAGALVATAGVMLPSFLIMLAIAWCFAGFAQNRHVLAGMRGLRPAVLGLIGGAVWFLARTLFVAPEGGLPAVWRGVVVFAAVAAVEWRWRLHPVKLIAVAAALGVLLNLCFP